MKFIKAVLFVIFFLTVTTPQSFAKENGNCNCTLTENIEQFYEEYSFNASLVIKLKDLTPAEVKIIRDKLCMNISFASHAGFDPGKFKKVILEGLGLDNNIDNATQVVSSFLNKYKQDLVCPKLKSRKGSRDMHIFKSAITSGVAELFDELLDEDLYDIDYNAYEIVDGKKETLLDYLDEIISSGQYDNDDMELLRDDIIEAGGKRGSELKD
tara:strand:+ start:132 stop:767 length:636 start_codon:yes stop_codon:yes gene_type:complete